LGLGNTLLGDDGLGPALIEHFLHEGNSWADQVEFLDGGTQGLALLSHLSNRKVIIIIDALATGAPPGTVSVLELADLLQMGTDRANTPHEGNAGELLAFAKVLDELPNHVFIVGVEPESVATGFGPSETV